MKRLILGAIKLAFILIGLVFTLVFGKTAKPLPKPFWASVYVIDGDTVGISGTKTKIRLFGIDAPERGQAQGAEATNFLKSIALKQRIHVKPIEFDRYGRIVATLTREDDVNINATMVAHGYALAETRYTKAYVRLQKQARKQRLGLWAQGGIQNPRAWREANS